MNVSNNCIGINLKHFHIHDNAVQAGHNKPKYGYKTLINNLRCVLPT